jgi:hypothetical protein
MKPAKEYILKNGQYLSEVLDELPYGIFNKTETGLGATTLELKSERNSIIVEPLKVTASSKAYKHNACYIGSATKFHPDKDKHANLKRIKAHLEDKSITCKKFVTVADSLGSLLSELGELSKDYFLMIDEADRTQLDVGFRSTMEDVLNIYKTHPNTKRCLITATPILFNDPDLQYEPYHVCKFEKPIRRKINLITTNEGAGVIIDKVLEIYNSSSDKIVIAINEVALSYEMANELVKEGVEKMDIQILCSKSSDRKAGEYFNQINSSELATRITFKTSAYFNGFDIDNRYHLFTYIHPYSTTHILSDKTIKQIAGRCRDKNGLLSENVVYQDGMNANRSEPLYTIEDLKKDAQILIDSLACIDTHFKHSQTLKLQAATIFDSVTKNASIYGYPLIKNSTTAPSISYLSLDAILEMNKVINTQYCNPKAMNSVLSLENDVITCQAKSTRKINSSAARSKSIAEEKVLVDETLTELIDLGFSTGERFGLAPSLSQLTEKGCYNVSAALDIYNKFRLNVDNLQLKEHLLKAFNSSKVNSLLKKLNKQLTFICADESDTLKKAVRTKFEIGKTYTAEEVKDLMLTLYKEHSTAEKIDMKPQVLTEQFNMFVESTQTTRKDITSGRVYKVHGYNTLGIEVYSSNKEHLTNDEVFMKLMQSALF